MLAVMPFLRLSCADGVGYRLQFCAPSSVPPTAIDKPYLSLRTQSKGGLVYPLTATGVDLIKEKAATNHVAAVLEAKAR